MKNKLTILLLCVSISVYGEEKGALPLPNSGQVTLTLAEYNRLVDLAAKSAKKRELPPIPYTIKRAELKLKAGSETVMGTLLMDGEVFSKSAARVPLTSGMTILNAQQEGRGLPLQQEGATAVAILPGASDFSVTLSTGMPLKIDAGRASFNLPAPAAGSVRLSLVIPGDHTNVRISPGLITGRISANGQTTIEATLAPGSSTSVWWTTRELAAPVVTREVRFLSDVKTLVSVSEADLRIAALADITVVQGEPSQFVVEVPKGYEITGASGATVESSEIADNTLVLHLTSGTPRSHQFLISMEKTLDATKTEVPFLSFKDTQRETGEVLVEGAGAMELTATEGGGLKRLDLKEISPYLRSLSRFPLQAAFRYHRQPTETPKLALEWVRFPDSAVLAAVAERAMVTTLVTTEGRTLTEVKLTVKNQAQPFLKIGLPAGASILTAEVAGEKVKPVQGQDGIRVPLLRPGFRTNTAYEVSFVFMHSGLPFARKGGSELALPAMNIPISVLQWEVFLPEQYKVKDFGGDAIAASLLPASYSGDKLSRFDVGTGAGIDIQQLTTKSGTYTYSGVQLQTLSDIAQNEGLDSLVLLAPGVVGGVDLDSMQSGDLGGSIVDSQGAVIPGAQVVVRFANGETRQTATDSSGRWLVSAVPRGQARIEASASGFKSAVRSLNYEGKPGHYSFTLTVGGATETVEVSSGGKEDRRRSDEIERDLKKSQMAAQTSASVNVLNLQRRVAGVLPVRIDVPHAGNSYSFVRPLVLDEETKVTFNYKSK